MFDTTPYEEKMNHVLEHLEERLGKIRTGRAHASMLDGIMVEAYGTSMPLNQVANVTAPEATLLQITPFDPANLQKIASAIRADQALGLNPSDDGHVVRVPVPPLTEERRKQLVKQASEKDAKRRKEAKELSEDDVKAVEKEIDRLMAQHQTTIEAAFAAKEKDILTI